VAHYNTLLRFSQETKRRLYENLPEKPYCTNDLTRGLRVRAKNTAFNRYTYLQINRYYQTAYLTFDVDRGGAALAWEEADLLAPTFVTVNPENLHAHLVYELFTPVLLWENAREKPIEWLNAVRRAYTEALDADAGYCGLISKNPNHSRWYVLDFNARYELVELSESIDLKTRHFTPQKGVREDFASEGRNNFLFELGRFYAYRKVRQSTDRGELHNSVYAHIENLNITEFPDPLERNELRHIAKSISKWTWNNREGISEGRRRKTKDDEDLRARQVQSAYSTAEIKRAATEARIKKVIDTFLREGRTITKAAIAREANVNRSTVYEYGYLFEKVSD